MKTAISLAAFTLLSLGTSASGQDMELGAVKNPIELTLWQSLNPEDRFIGFFVPADESSGMNFRTCNGFQKRVMEEEVVRFADRSECGSSPTPFKLYSAASFLEVTSGALVVDTKNDRIGSVEAITLNESGGVAAYVLSSLIDGTTAYKAIPGDLVTAWMSESEVKLILEAGAGETYIEGFAELTAPQQIEAIRRAAGVDAVSFLNPAEEPREGQEAERFPVFFTRAM